VATIQANGLRRGTAVIHDGTPYRVLEFEHRTPGNKRGFVQTKLRNLLDGTQREVKFSANDFVERATIEAREMEFLYRDSSGSVFMDTESYDQMPLSDELLGDAAPWLSEGMRVGVEQLDGNPIGVQLPKTIEIEVADTEGVVKGQTAARSNKPATLSNGERIQVPLFINRGDRIRVDPAEKRYVDRVK